MKACNHPAHVWPPNATEGDRCVCGDYLALGVRGMVRRHKPVSELVREMKERERWSKAN